MPKIARVCLIVIVSVFTTAIALVHFSVSVQAICNTITSGSVSCGNFTGNSGCTCGGTQCYGFSACQPGANQDWVKCSDCASEGEARDCACGGTPCPTPPGGCGSSPNGTCCDATDVTSQTFNAGNGGTCSASCNGNCYFWQQSGSCGWQLTDSSNYCNPTPGIPVRGYKVLMPGNVQPAAGSTIDTQFVTAGGNSSAANPYTISAPGSCTYPTNLTVSATIPSTYSVGYTQCNSTQADCTITDTPASPNFFNLSIPGTDGNLWSNPSLSSAQTTISVSGTSATANANSIPSTVDLWWHYCTSNGWHNSGTCQTPQGQSCGPGGVQHQYDDCGNERDVPCSTTCSFFQTFGGDVTMKGNLANTQLPLSGYYISGR